MVSAIVVNYNGKRWLPKLLSALQNQTYPEVEIIVVDSGSVDESVNFVRDHWPEVKLIPASNRGYGAACNDGARQARGEYVFFLNEDMYVDPEFVEELVASYLAIKKQDPKIGALACSQYHWDRTPRPPIRPGKVDIFSYPGPVKPPGRRGGFIPGSPFFIPRALFLESGGFCPHIFLYNDDTDLSWRLVLMGYRQYAAPQVIIYHYDAASMPGMPPKKIYYYVYSTLICIFNNYSAPWLPVFLVLNLFYTMLAILPGLLIFTNDRSAYTRAVVRGIYDFTKKVPAMLEWRRQVQRRRVISDRQFLTHYVRIVPSLLASRAYRRL